MHRASSTVLVAALVVGVEGRPFAQAADAGPAIETRAEATDGGSVADGAGRQDAEATYVPSVTVQTRQPVRWMRSNCVLLRPHLAGSRDIDDGSDHAAIQRAVDHWHAAIGDCSYIRVELQDPSPDAVPRYDEGGNNENVIYWVEDEWAYDARAAGITTVFFIDDPDRSDDGRILDADIELNSRFRFSSSGDPNRTDIENTVVHELGHLLGLDHTCDDGARRPTPADNTGQTIPSCLPFDDLSPNITEATMFNNAAIGETKKRSPEAGDILGVCTTYPLVDDPGVCVPVEALGKSRGCSLVSGQLTSLAVGGLLLALLGMAGARRRRSRRSQNRNAASHPVG